MPLLVSFDNRMTPDELWVFCAAMRKLAPDTHAHLTRFGANEPYPPIQYGLQSGKLYACILPSMAQQYQHWLLLPATNKAIREKLGLNLMLRSMTSKSFELEILQNELEELSLLNWIPFGYKDGLRWLDSSDNQRAAMLTKALVTQVEKVAKALDVKYPELPTPTLGGYRVLQEFITPANQELLCMDADFLGRFCPPEWMGLGTGVACGFGRTVRGRRFSGF